MKMLSILLILLSHALAFAHGEDKPGPNGGEIRMPGAFHTEVKGKEREFEVFLLDIEFKNPIVANSSVEARVTQMTLPSKEFKLTCRPSKAARPPRFICVSADYKPADGDILVLKAKRGTSFGNEVRYKLPLLAAKSGVEESPSSAHDSHHGHQQKTSGHPSGHED